MPIQLKMELLPLMTMERSFQYPIRHPPNAKASEVEHLKGIICPGFVNTHCHLELSHLKDKLTQGNGLINFIKEIQAVRGADDDSYIKSC